MKQVLFSGTFDPPTLGHLDIIKRASKICDKLFVGIACSGNKDGQANFSVEEKKEMLTAMTKDLTHVEIASIDGLVVDFAKQHNIHFLLRGLRAFSDFEYEFRMALANKKLSGIETMFLMADEKYFYISSTLIRELAYHKSRLNEFVPSSIEEFVFQRLFKSRS